MFRFKVLKESVADKGVDVFFYLEEISGIIVLKATLGTKEGSWFIAEVKRNGKLGLYDDVSPDLGLSLDRFNRIKTEDIT